MKDWKRHWETFPKNAGTRDYLRQVGKTVNGQPISNKQFDLVLFSIRNALCLRTDDTVLDLCCGNGLITKQIAGGVRMVTGIDFSKPLISVASTDQCAENVQYLRMSVLDINAKTMMNLPRFTKIYLYEALQHFAYSDLRIILRNILSLSCPTPTIFLGSIPDRKGKWNFYNTNRRRLDYVLRRIRGQEAIGTWWSRERIERTCREMNLRSQFIRQDEQLHTAHYRFDARISRMER